MTSEAPSGDKEPKTQTGSTGELLQRVISAVVLAAIALGALFVSPWSFLALVVVCSGLLLWEWGNATRGNGFDGTTLLQTICVIVLVVFFALGNFDLGLVVAGATAAAIAVSGRGNGARWSLFALGGLVYVALPAIALVWLRNDPKIGLAAVLFLLIVAWTTDTASYVGGQVIGGPKLAPNVSPKKTWSGFFVGTLTPLLVGYGFARYVGDTSAWALALIAFVLAFACQMGDLLESAVKRHLGIKDMSQLVPGHGGLFDRIDGLLLAAVVAALIAFLRDPTAPGAGLLIW